MEKSILSHANVRFAWESYFFTFVDATENTHANSYTVIESTKEEITCSLPVIWKTDI